ncbi:hypothetical protein [Psychroserpens damuponensis]|uniref:hypothetical protein n=1 Tax=Psychroserpens damuponensis TaxID=943936 RepID=UPI00126A7761|nr:hypothetical protein [Psychroserpens damuponensis]
MKKLFTLLMCTAVLTFVSCEDEPLEGDFVTGGVSCEAAIANTAQAALNFLSVNDDNYEQLCLAYRSALQAQITACGDPDGSLQLALNALGDCSVILANNCEDATTAVASAQAAFNNATNDDYSTLCNAYRATLQNQIAQCGDEDGSIQLTIDDLGDCTIDNEEPADVTGTWLLTAWNGTEPIDLDGDGVESINFLDEMDCYENETIVFNTDGTGVTMSTSFASFIFDIVVGTTDEFSYTIECEFEDENTNFTWTQNGNIVSTSDGTDTTDLTLNGNELSIFVPEGFLAFSSDFTATTTQDLTFVYTKQ